MKKKAAKKPASKRAAKPIPAVKKLMRQAEQNMLTHLKGALPNASIGLVRNPNGVMLLQLTHPDERVVRLIASTLLCFAHGAE